MLASNVLKAQIYIDTTALIRAYNTSQYIFEGTVTSQCTYNDSRGIIYTSNIINITKIFKGGLTCGTVNIITIGGTFNGNTLTVSHTAQFNVGGAGVFACTISSYPFDSIRCPSHATNPTPLVCVDEYVGSFQYLFDEVNAQVIGFNSKFPTVQSFYNYLISLGVNITYCGGGGSIIEQMQQKKVKPYIPYKRTSTLPVASPKKATIESKTYKKQIFGKTDFDINFNVSSSGLSMDVKSYMLSVDLTSSQGVYLDDCTFKLTYNTDALGSYIASKIKGNLDINGYHVSFSDVSSSEFSCTISADNNPSSRFALPTFPTTVLTMFLPVENCKYTQDLTFDNYTNAASDCWYINTDDTTNTRMQFTTYNTPTDAYSNTCSPNITSVTTAPNIFGGVKQQLTINGSDFGASANQGIIYMQNADAASTATPALPLTPSTDVVSWDDNQIVINVPSLIDTFSSGGTPTQKGTVGSGQIMLVDAWGNVSNPSPNVIIDYSLRNVSNTTQGYYKNNQYLFSSHPDGIYHFKLNNGITDPRMISTIRAAFNKWICNTGVGFVLDTGSTIDGIVPVDNKNTIAITSLPTNVLLRTHINAKQTCSDDASMIFPTSDIDIAINVIDTSLFDYDTTGTQPITPNHYDFYHAILHELGHALCLDHVGNSGDLMYYSTPHGTIHVADRIINPSFWDIGGAYTVVIKSTNKSPAVNSTCSYNVPLTIYSHPCDLNAGIENKINTISNNIQAYPNPFNNQFNVSIKSDVSQKAEIIVYNLLGQKLIQTTQLLNVGENSIPFDASTFSNGLYLVYLKTSISSSLIKIVCTK